MSCAHGQAKDVDLAVKAASEALENSDWATMNGASRSKIMNKFADKLEANAHELAWIEGSDNGKPIGNAMMDVYTSAAIFRFNAGLADNIQGQAIPRDDQNNLVITRHEPVGVCGLITPWNFPLLMTCMKMAPSLAAGCTGVFKPSAEASLSSLKLAELWESIEGVPPGVVNMITGENEAG
jgi:acyl-CoA reductase-like NAD-dependent aldehyde dehydrogenase